jgi:hypothetical protein
MAEPIAHFYQSVPGWFDFPDLYAALVQRLPSGAHVVEVGGWKGQSAAFMGVEIANSGKAIQFDVVDTWQGSNEECHRLDPDVQNGRLYEAFLTHIEPVRELVRPIKLASVEAAATYPDASLDAVFIDADHSTEAVLADCQAWWPKVKPGGILAGHDRNWASVQKAVHGFGKFAGVRVRPTSKSCWEFTKPEQVNDWSVPEAERALVVAVCSNERSIYRQTVESVWKACFGAKVTQALEANGFQDAEPLWVSQYPSVAAQRDFALMRATEMGASHVLFLDADMTWQEDLLARMLPHHNKGIVGGVYCLKQAPYWPVALDKPYINAETLNTDYHYAPHVLNGDELVRVDLIGMGCTLIPMRVTRAFTRPWFEYMPDQVGLPAITEDVAFCARARAVGCPISVDPTIDCGHIGQHTVDRNWFFRHQMELRLLGAKKKAEEAGRTFPSINAMIDKILEGLDDDAGQSTGSAA